MKSSFSSGALLKITGATKPNVRVHIRRSIVQIQCERPIIRTIVPIAAADGRESERLNSLSLLYHKKMFDQITSLKNLFRTYNLARLGKRNRIAVSRFDFQADISLLNLKKNLLSGRYLPGRYRLFYVYDPKHRLISAPPFADRVVHHAVCQIIDPLFDKTFIYDSYACRKNKGSHLAVKRLQGFLRKTKTDYALKCDISKYFAHIDHDILFALIKKKITDDRLLALLLQIIDSYPRGIPIGNLTSQLFANIYLDPLDRYIKQVLRRKYYLRYVDDFIILGESKNDLKKVLAQITIFLQNHLKLTLHPRKVRLFPAKLGVDFVGYVVFPNHIRLRSKNVRRFKKRLKKLTAQLENGKITREYFESSINSWIGHASHADSFKLRQKLFASPNLQAFSPIPSSVPGKIQIEHGTKTSKYTPPAVASAKPANPCPAGAKISAAQLCLFPDWRE